MWVPSGLFRYSCGPPTIDHLAVGSPSIARVPSPLAAPQTARVTNRADEGPRSGGGAGGQSPLDPRLDARCEASVRTQRLAQRAHQIPLDHVEEDSRAGILTVEEPLEGLARQDEQKGPLAR